MTEQSMPSTQGTAAAKAAGVTAVAGPLTIRDLAVLGSVILIFIASLIPLVDTRAGSLNLWNTTNLFYMGVGMILPLATAALFLIRRFSPGTKLRLGSLSVDQFASVVAVFTAFFFFASITTNFRVAYLVGMIGGVLFLLSTICAPWIPVLAADFAGRPEIPAHPVARDAVAPAKRPSSPKPVVDKGTNGDKGAKGSSVGTAGSASSAGEAGGAAVGSAADDGSAATPAAGWSGNRPADVHTRAGQIYTPAKDTRSGSGSGVGAAAGAAAGAAVGAAGSAAGTASAAPAANSASGSSTTAGITADSTSDTSAKSAATQSSSGASQTSSVDAEDQPTSLNPQLPTPAEEQAATNKAAENEAVKDSAKSAETAKPAAADAAASGAKAKEAATPAKDNSVPARQSIAATVDPKATAPAVITEPFWFAVDRPQNVIDEKTRQFIYKLTPGSWILALEDRGSSFLVQDSHGKTGVLLDLVGIERASDSQ